MYSWEYLSIYDCSTYDILLNLQALILNSLLQIVYSMI